MGTAFLVQKNFKALVTDGLILHLDASNPNSYPGSGTTWFDISGNGHHGSLSNVTYNTSNGGSFFFNGGSTTHVDLGSPTGLRVTTGSTTHCFWIRITATDTSFRAMAGNGTGGASRASNFYIFNGQPWAMHLTHGPASGQWAGTVSSGQMNNNTWYYVCGVIDNTTQRHRYYVNGNLVDDLQVSPWYPVQASTDTYYIGRADNRFLGDISETHRYNRPLSNAEVLQNWNATKVRFGL